MDNVLWFLIWGSFLVGFMGILVYHQQKGPKYPLQSMTYESGEYAQKNTAYQWPIAYYLIAVLFLLFEAEVILLLPWSVYASTVIKKKYFSSYGSILVIGVLFILTLFLGFLYMLYKGCFSQKKIIAIPYLKTPVPLSVYRMYNFKNQSHQENQ